MHFGAKAGLVVVPVNDRLQSAEVEHILRDVGAAAAVVAARLADIVSSADISLRLGFGSGHGQPLDYEQALAECEPEPPPVKLDDEDLNVIAYTSGTTGVAKGAMLTHRGSVLSAYGYGMATRFRSDDVVLTCMPSYVLRGPVRRPLTRPGRCPRGAHGVVADFAAAEVVRITERRRITQVQLSAAMITLLLREADLYLVDRRVDVIVSGGLNVYSLEVEQVINQMPGVVESAVVGIPHELWGEAVAAFVVCEPGAAIGEAAVIAHCQAELAHFKVPQSVRFLAELPRNAMGKLDKRAIRATYWSGSGRGIAG